MYTLKRKEAIQAITAIIQQQDNNVLQDLYCDECVVKLLCPADIFKLWHGFLALDSLSDACIQILLEFFGLDFLQYHEYKDCSAIVDEFLDGIENQNTRYITQKSLSNIGMLSDQVYKKDLPELTREEAVQLVNAMIEKSSPSTIQQAVRRASAFCDWCIKHKKYTNAQNNFKPVIRISYEPWVINNIVKDDVDLMCRFSRAGYVFDEGDPAPPLLALAWMGYDQKQVLDIKNEDVDVIQHKVFTQDIPPSLYEIFQKYEGGSLFVTQGQRQAEFWQEDLGYYIKRLVKAPFGERFDAVAINNCLNGTGFKYDNIWLSGMLYRLYCYEKQNNKLIDTDFLKTYFQITSSTAQTRYRQVYDAYKSVYWENA